MHARSADDQKATGSISVVSCNILSQRLIMKLIVKFLFGHSLPSTDSVRIRIDHEIDREIFVRSFSSFH